MRGGALCVEERAAGSRSIHCTHCQRESGSLFSFNLVVREADYEQSGETMIYVDKGDSGQQYIAISAGAAGLLSLQRLHWRLERSW